MILCKTCEHRDEPCDILIKVQTVADLYGLEIEVKVNKCNAYKKKVVIT